MAGTIKQKSDRGVGPAISPENILSLTSHNFEKDQISSESIHVRGRPVSSLLSKRFGRLTVISYYSEPRKLGERNQGSRWNCKCDCGLEVVVASKILRRGDKKSCGCAVKKREKSIADEGLQLFYFEYMRGAMKRHLSFAMSVSLFLELTKKPCHYCGTPPQKRERAKPNNVKVKFKASGIDREDSSVGYEATNVVPCCTHCNLAKRDFSSGQFTEWLKQVARHINSLGAA